MPTHEVRLGLLEAAVLPPTCHSDRRCICIFSLVSALQRELSSSWLSAQDRQCLHTAGIDLWIAAWLTTKQHTAFRTICALFQQQADVVAMPSSDLHRRVRRCRAKHSYAAP